MDKKEVAAVLEEIALLLELAGENPFKVRAFEAGARAVLTFPGDLDAARRSGELAHVKGIGKSLAGVIEELLTRGEAALHRELRNQTPPGLLELLRVPGLGPKKARVLVDELHITSLGELEYACRENRLAGASRLRGQIPGEDQGRPGQLEALRRAFPPGGPPAPGRIPGGPVAKRSRPAPARGGRPGAPPPGGGRRH